ADVRPCYLQPTGPRPRRTTMADPHASQGAPQGSSSLRVLGGADSTVEGLLEELGEVLEELRECHRSLADAPDPGGPRERRVRELLDRREALQGRLGTEIVRVLAAGGTIR